MSLFVHLTSEKNIRTIRRNGIKPHRKRSLFQRGVFAMPMLDDFYVSHQWLRELKRGGQRTFIGIYFRIPDDELVLVGHYNSEHLETTASKATKIISEAENPFGYEIIIPRVIQTNEIHRISYLPQVIGWRYFPNSKGKPPCVCLCCQGGQYGIRKLEKAVKEAKAKNKPTKIIWFGGDD